MSIVKLFCIVVTLAAGCAPAADTGDAGDDSGAPVADMAVIPDLVPVPPPPDLYMRPYPPPPYGTKLGDIISDVTSKGYPLSLAQTDYTQLTFGVIHLSDLSKNPACKCILITQGAEWCPPCNMEQPELTAAVAKGSDRALMDCQMAQ